MSLAGELYNRFENPIKAHVRFDSRTEEDKAASRAAGYYVSKDVDYAIITSPYSDGKEDVHMRTSDWFVSLKQQVNNGSITQKWVDDYIERYKKWKMGQELPEDGVPIKGWGVISPAQQETLIQCGIRTVDALAQLNEVGARAIGMGAYDLKNRAMAWMLQLKDKGAVTLEVAALKRDLAVKDVQISTLTRQIEQLSAVVKSYESGREDTFKKTTEISSTDILPDMQTDFPVAVGAAPTKDEMLEEV